MGGVPVADGGRVAQDRAPYERPGQVKGRTVSLPLAAPCDRRALPSGPPPLRCFLCIAKEQCQAWRRPGLSPNVCGFYSDGIHGPRCVDWEKGRVVGGKPF